MPPGAPTRLEAISKESSAILTWELPVNRGKGLTGFSITAYPLDNGASVIAIRTNGALTQTEVVGLTSGKLYNFDITANDVDGPSERSLRSNTVRTGAQIFQASVQNAERSAADATDYKAAKTTLKYHDSNIPTTNTYTPFKSNAEYIRYLKGRVLVSRSN